jgi:hypothetical protein
MSLPTTQARAALAADTDDLADALTTASHPSDLAPRFHTPVYRPDRIPRVWQCRACTALRSRVVPDLIGYDDPQPWPCDVANRRGNEVFAS